MAMFQNLKVIIIIFTVTLTTLKPIASFVKLPALL